MFKLNKKLNPDPVSQVTERRYQGEAVEDEAEREPGVRKTE